MQKRINTTIDDGDYKYCKENKIRFAHAIRAYVRDHKVNVDAKDAEPTLRELRRQKDKIMAHRAKILDALRKRFSEEEFINFITSI